MSGPLITALNLIFSDKINTLAEELREEDKQVINFSKENFKSYGPIKKTETFIHEENKSKSGFIHALKYPFPLAGNIASFFSAVTLNPTDLITPVHKIFKDSKHLMIVINFY